ncbi:hypothetical protein DPMN_005992 [Dreissena polymorpha]|uniref:Uncharacterized protein n=1 Tax=Dreissena polymorpha TaxID=45954 RepID=A0A9D4RXC5_DREPO|nr:hypothetical protein DPMN_005992 [Dreissena polymorpha]
MLFSNNVNLRPGEQHAIDAIQQQLLSAVLGFGVATLATRSISVYGPVAAAATRTMKPVPTGSHAVIDWYPAEQQAVWDICHHYISIDNPNIKALSLFWMQLQSQLSSQQLSMY